MENTIQNQQFKDIFQNSLRLNARSTSIKTLLSERNLKRIDYSPYYQRNYVWDNAKQTFFIESVILGTEIPPLILFKTGKKIEVIDGRQRFETLKRFKENEITLKTKGLMELQVLNKVSFNKLSPINQEIFLSSNIRIFEFEIINQPNLKDEVIDRIKKEIFRRYNTGITPLSRDELDNAKYDEDPFSDFFKEELRNDFNFLNDFNTCFFPKNVVSKSGNNDGIITKNVDFIRRYRILKSFPISKYAAGGRIETIELLYDFAKNNTEADPEEFSDFKSILMRTIDIYNEMSDEVVLRNKYIYECILWALTILKEKQIEVTFDKKKFSDHFRENINNYSEDSSHHYGNIITRYTDTSTFFSSITDFDFNGYIKNEDFKERLSELRQTEVDAAKSIEELSSLRSNKPNPISTPVDEIRNDLKSTRYLVRPSYQRQEKINISKASSIIESILLGINLPPIFIFIRKDNIKEIVDGQQRLLAIIGFLGEQYYNENGNFTYSKNNNFKLKDLRILTNLEGCNFSSLTDDQQDKILDFVIDLIIIEQGVNTKFDPIDLFIRLNYKPYPIKNNSFEMWNSIIDIDIIRKIKTVTSNNDHLVWFYLREKVSGKPDRMLNEEMITILSYISYNNARGNDIEEIIGFFPRKDRITCRLKNKKAMTSFLLDLDTDEKEKQQFILSIDRTSELIDKLGKLFPELPTKDTFNNFLNVKNNLIIRRSLQDFYLIWLIIDNISEYHFQNSKNLILDDIRRILSILKNVNDDEVNDIFLTDFKKELDLLKGKYN
ncbi:DUF262 domain-containing protein [Aquimarina macrocephali]|uniref:DUF262 domain-containing protein n=1 Tax=Aquimarina macrocephali TaxID=666563 RepID=UPI0004632F79|nr:DUF262 domain-containing protein [Aquimarina macrocephali]